MRLIKPVITFCISAFFVSSLFAQASPQTDTAKTTQSFEKVEVEADFAGGVQAWRKYLEKNLKAGTPGDNGAPVGKYSVTVRFIVDKDGSTSEIKAETKLGYGMEEEVIRAISQSGKWAPAMQNGKPVRAYRRQPITFLVESDDYAIITEEPYTLYASIDNIVTVTAGKVKPENIELTVQGGTASPTDDGKFIIRVKKAGRAIIEINNTKKNKFIGTVSIEVKTK